MPREGSIYPTGSELLKEKETDLIIGYRLDIFAKAKRVFNFLPEIIENSRTDERILNKWMFFFICKKVPFLVTLKNKKKVLWKPMVSHWED